MGVADTKRSVRAAPLRTGSTSSTLLNLFARLVAWYLLYTVLFRCPEVPTNDSPTICHTANTVSTTLRPHLEPYYIQYVEPYVSEYAPYVKKANEEYLVPVYDKAQASYERHAGPHVSSSRDYVLKEYNRFAKPCIDEVSSKAKVYYTEYLSPHVAKCEELYTSAQPHINSAQNSVGEVYKDIFIPAYEKASPHVVKAYEQTKHVVVTVVAPMVRQNGEKAVYWGIGIWSDVVRPQVGRIGERLGGTGNGTPAGSQLSSLSTATDASEATVVSSIITSTSAEDDLAASASVVSEAEDGSDNIDNTNTNSAKKLTPEEVAVIINEDLAIWAGKFKDNQGQTIDDLNAGINKISTEAKGKKASYVEKEIAALEKLVDVEFKNIKKTTIKIASGLGPGSSVEEKQAALESLFATTRDAGIKIRDKAQEQRLESQKYLASTYDDVAEAADNFLEAFDSMLDLSMQELGMKWAWMEHVSYKAWGRYHEMKDDFENLKRVIVTAAQSNQELIDITRWVESDWEGKATDIAKYAAEELQRLKRVSKKKIDLADSSDDFSDVILSVMAGKAEQQVLKKVEEVEETFHSEVAGDVAEKASAAAIGTEQLSEKTSGTETASSVSKTILETEESTPLAASAFSTASAATESVKVRVPGGVNAGFVGASRVEYEEDPEDEAAAEIDAAGEKLVDVPHAVSQAPAEATIAGEKYASIASEKLESAASSVLYETLQPVGESLVSVAADGYSAAITAGSSIYGALNPRAKLFASLASEAYARAVTSANDEYRRAMRSVATMIYPADLPNKSSARSAAVETYDEALDTAEDEYTGLLNQASSAQQQYDAALQEAKEIYQSAVDAASAAIHGSVAESLVSFANEQYQQALRAAEKTYDVWYNFASKVVTPPSTSAIIITSSKYLTVTADGANVNAAPGGSYGTTQALTASIASAAREYASVATNAAEKPIKEFASAASAATDAAEERYESMKEFVSELVNGKEPAYTESVMSRLSSLMYGTEAPIVAKATSAIGEAYNSVSSVVAENYESATEKVKEVYSMVRDEL